MLTALQNYKLPDRYTITGGSPVELRVYDAQNNITGIVNGSLKENVSSSACDPDSKTIMVFSPQASYTYEVCGTGQCSYGLNITSVKDNKAIFFTTSNIPIFLGTIHWYSIDWNTLAQGQPGVTIQIDSNGDGKFESTITSDGTLTHDEFLQKVLFGNAITALNGNITLGNNAIVTSSPAPNNGNVFANGNISLGNNAKVNGNAGASGNIIKGNNASISGTTTPNAKMINFPPIDTSAYLTKVQLAKGGTVAQGANYSNGGTISNAETRLQGNLNLNNNKSLTVNGDLYVDGGLIILGNNSTLNVSGKIFVAAGSITANNNSKLSIGGTLYLSGNLQTGNSSTLNLGETIWIGGEITLNNNSSLSGPKVIVANNSIIFNNNSVVGDSKMPWTISTNGGFNIGNGVKISACLYAPSAGVTLNNNVSLMGSIAAKSVTAGNDCKVTYATN